MSGLVYTLSMNIPEGIQVPAYVKDSLDEALMVAEGLPAQASDALIAAERAAFDEAFVVILIGLALFLALASFVVAWTGASFKHETGKEKSAV